MGYDRAMTGLRPEGGAANQHYEVMVLGDVVAGQRLATERARTTLKMDG
jgi:hypothetical protein